MKEVLTRFAEFLRSKDAEGWRTPEAANEAAVEAFIEEQLPDIMSKKVESILEGNDIAQLETAQAIACFYAGQVLGLKTKVQKLEDKLSDNAFDFCYIDGCEGASTECWKTCPTSMYNVYAKEKIKVRFAEFIEEAKAEMETKVTARGMISEEKVISILIEKYQDLLKKCDERQPE